MNSLKRTITRPTKPNKAIHQIYNMRFHQQYSIADQLPRLRLSRTHPSICGCGSGTIVLWFLCGLFVYVFLNIETIDCRSEWGGEYVTSIFKWWILLVYNEGINGVHCIVRHSIGLDWMQSAAIIFNWIVWKKTAIDRNYLNIWVTWQTVSESSISPQNHLADWVISNLINVISYPNFRLYNFTSIDMTDRDFFSFAFESEIRISNFFKWKFIKWVPRLPTD